MHRAGADAWEDRSQHPAASSLSIRRTVPPYTSVSYARRRCLVDTKLVAELVGAIGKYGSPLTSCQMSTM